MTKAAKCTLCGEPMPEGEQMFRFHGYSGPCPKPPLASHRGPPQPAPEGYTEIKDYIAEQEKDPARKAALDRARERIVDYEVQDFQPVPVEPQWVTDIRSDVALCIHRAWMPEVLRHYDALKIALQSAQQERDAADEQWKEVYFLSAELTEKAEAQNKRLVELLKEPSKAMLKAGSDYFMAGGSIDGTFKAMSAELLREVDK